MLVARDNVAARTITNVKARDASNTLRQCQFVRVRDAGNVLRTVWAFLTAAATPSAVTGYANSASPININTSGAVAAPSGGTPPYSYAWARTDGGGDAWTINSPSAASTTFQATGVNPGDAFTATFACTVTDSLGVTATTSDVSATSINTNTS